MIMRSTLEPRKHSLIDFVLVFIQHLQQGMKLNNSEFIYVKWKNNATSILRGPWILTSTKNTGRISRDKIFCSQIQVLPLCKPINSPVTGSEPKFSRTSIDNRVYEKVQEQNMYGTVKFLLQPMALLLVGDR